MYVYLFIYIHSYMNNKRNIHTIFQPKNEKLKQMNFHVFKIKTRRLQKEQS